MDHNAEHAQFNGLTTYIANLLATGSHLHRTEAAAAEATAANEGTVDADNLLLGSLLGNCHFERMVGREAKAAAEGRILLGMGKLFLLRALVKVELGAGLAPEPFLPATLPLLSDLHPVDRVEVTFHCENEFTKNKSKNEIIMRWPGG